VSTFLLPQRLLYNFKQGRARCGLFKDAGNSRLYAGIHYQPSIDTGLIQGRKVTANIIAKLQIHK
jgi:hypothetical protein